MKKIFFLIGLLVFVFACGQEKKQTMNTQYPEINSNNFEQKLLNAVKQYDKEPMYYMRINKINCLIEVLINDSPVHKDYELSNYATPLSINRAILKSGEQKLTYRLYPLGELIKEEYGEGDTVTTLTDNTAISISIIKIDNNGHKELEDEEVVMKHISLNDAKGNFIASGKPYYEFTFSFNAQVPYINEGWCNGQDLSKLDQKILEEKALDFYISYSQIFEKKNKDLLAKVSFGLEKRNSIASYKKTFEINDVWQEYLLDLNASNTTIKIIKDYKIVLFGNNKIVFLRLNSLRPDYRGRGALVIENDDYIFSPGLYLYLPEGKKLEDGLYMIN